MVAQYLQGGRPLTAEQCLALAGWPTFGEWLKDKCPDLNWDWPYLKYLCGQLDRVTVGEIDRLMIFMPPRHGKSTCVTERYPVYLHDMVKGVRTIVAAYTKDLAARFSRESKDLAGKLGLLKGKALETEWSTQGGGLHRAVGIGGGVTGFGADVFIIDDPIKDPKEAASPVYRQAVKDWFDKAASTRLEPGGAMIIILTRWHEDDLAGWLQRERPHEWGPDNIIKFPAVAMRKDAIGREPGEALCPERYNVAALNRIEKGVSESTWWALYQQEPRPAGGAVYIRAWWDGDQGRYDSRDPAFRNRCIARFLSWDTAFKDNPEADFTACSVFELGPDYRVYLREVYRAHLKYPELIDTITSFAHRYNIDNKLHSVIIEDKASGISALQDLQKSAPDWLKKRIRAFKVDSSKVERAQEAALRCRAGSVLLPYPNETTPWLLEFEDELFSFPASLHKDRVDSFTQGILCLEDLLILGEKGRTYGAA